MVSIIKFLDDANNVRWVYVSDGSYSICTTHYLEDEDYYEYDYSLDEIVIDSGYLSDLELEHEYYWFIYIAERYYSR